MSQLTLSFPVCLVDWAQGLIDRVHWTECSQRSNWDLVFLQFSVAGRPGTCACNRTQNSGFLPFNPFHIQTISNPHHSSHTHIKSQKHFYDPLSIIKPNHWSSKWDKPIYQWQKTMKSSSKGRSIHFLHNWDGNTESIIEIMHSMRSEYIALALIQCN